MLGEGDSPLLAQVLARLGIELYWSDRDQAVSLCQQAADMARRVDDPHTMIVALWGRWHSLRNPDSLEQRLADTKEMIAIAERAGERDFALEARYYRVADLLESGDIVGVDVAHREYLSAEAELRDRFKRGLLLEGMRAHMDGRLDEADALAKHALEAGQQSGRPLAPNSFLIQHGMSLWERGRMGELEPTLRGFITHNPLIVFARCALQLSLLQLGRPEEARIEFERLAEGEFGSCSAIGTGCRPCSCWPTFAPTSGTRNTQKFSIGCSRPIRRTTRCSAMSTHTARSRMRSAGWRRCASALMTPRSSSRPPWPPIGESGPRSGWPTRSANWRACF